MSTVKRWKIKEHYVAGEFAGYVVVTDDKYEDVVCHGIGVDYRPTAVLIASAPELEAERDRLREALKEIAKFADSEYRKRIPAPSCVEFSTIKRYAEKALEGTEMSKVKCHHCHHLNRQQCPAAFISADGCGDFRPRTNFDRITESPEILAKFVTPEICPTVDHHKNVNCQETKCYDCWLKWLNQEADHE